MNKIKLFRQTCRQEGFKIAVVRAAAILMGVRISGFYEPDDSKEEFLQRYRIAMDAVKAPALISTSIKRAMFYEPEKTVELVNTCVAQVLVNYGRFLNETGTDVYLNRKNVFEAALMFPQNQNYSRHLAENIFNQWQWEGASEELLERCEQVVKNASGEAHVKKVYLIYISSLMELKKEERAQSTLRAYVKKYGKKDIHVVYPAALLAERLGISNEKIHKAAVICEVILQNENLLETYFAGKSVAVVGSGPYESGKGRGDEIDRHDVVVRFNDYRTDRFAQDYGKKANVWVRNIDTENGGCAPRLNELHKFDLVVLESNIWRFFMPEMFLDDFYAYAVTMKERFCMLKHRDRLIREMGSFPTSGGQLLFELCQIRDCIRSIDVYGFSYMYQTEGNRKALRHISDAAEEFRYGNLHHNLRVEAEYLKRLMRGTGDSEGYRDG